MTYLPKTIKPNRRISWIIADLYESLIIENFCLDYEFGTPYDPLQYPKLRSEQYFEYLFSDPELKSRSVVKHFNKLMEESDFDWFYVSAKRIVGDRLTEYDNESKISVINQFKKYKELYRERSSYSNN